MKNYSELIKDKQKWILTAKGNKFVWKCIDVISELRGFHPFSPEIKEEKEKLRKLLYNLIIDKEMSAQEIKDVIRQSIDIKKEIF